jgi:tRNA threonylcarbamoyladenosine biosynthesis protein TsaB
VNILAFDTGTEYLCAAVETARGYYESLFRIGLKHAEHLLPEIEHLLTKAGIRPQDLDLIVCTRGPGSFTGLRIGMATAKGLARGADVPLVSVPSLDVYAHFIPRTPDTLIIPSIDARKQRFYAAFIDETSQMPAEIHDAAPEKIAQITSSYAHIIFTGPDAQKLHARIQPLLDPSLEVTVDESSRRGWGQALIRLGRLQFESLGADTEDQGPVYIRKSEAEIGLENR